MERKPFYLGLCSLVLSLSLSQAHAGVFNLPHFVTPGEFAIGVEPEFILSSGAGTGINTRYTHGISDMNNLSAILGTGSGPRQFRIGGAFTFDFFPDLAHQPGLGLALQGLFVQYAAASGVETTAIPYIHKLFRTEVGFNIEPFLAIPIGLSLSQGMYQTISSAVVGCLFEHSEHFRTSMELGINLSNTNTYISAGVIYYH